MSSIFLLDGGAWWEGWRLGSGVRVSATVLDIALCGILGHVCAKGSQRERERERE